jgi:hypothetical protein
VESEERLIAEDVRDVLSEVERLVNEPYLHETSAVLIGALLRGADREQALARVLHALDARPRARLEAQSDKPGPLYGTPARGLMKRRASLRGLDGRKYVERLYGSPLSDSLAVTEARERLRGGRAGKLMQAYVVVVPGGAFQPARRGRNRWEPTPALQEFLDSELVGLSEPEIREPRFQPRPGDERMRESLARVGIDITGRSRGWRPPEPGEPLPPGWQGPPPPGWYPPGGSPPERPTAPPTVEGPTDG